MRKFFGENSLHLAFRIGLFLKGAFALTESIAGIAAYFFTQRLLHSLVYTITQDELAEDSRGLIANFLRQSVNHFTGNTQHFAAYYLLGHGVVKLWLIIGLLRKQLWYYPVAIAVFGLFVVYQLYRFSFTHSLWLLLITALDLAVMALTWYEYQFLRRESAR